VPAEGAGVMRLRKTAVAVSCVLLLGAAACGDDDDDDDAAPLNEAGVPTDFLSEAEAICASANEEIDAIFNELFGGEEEPSPEESQELINDALDIHVAAFDDVQALDSFPDDPDIGAVFDDMDDAEAEVREQVSTPEGAAALFESDESEDPISVVEDRLAELGLSECAAEEDAESFEGRELTDAERASATELDVTAVEFSFTGVPAELASGPLVLTFSNGGDLEHEIGIVKIKDGVNAEDAVAKAKADRDDESYIETFVGGAFSNPGADGVEFTDVLEPGLYGYACFIETDDGQTHASLGMISTFTAT
jgi:hypothetical protein